MIRNVLRLTVIGYVWGRYGSLIVSTVALFAWFWIAGKMHEDYIAYAGLQDGNGFLGISYLIKWLAFLAGIAVYWFFNSRVRKKWAKRAPGATPLRAPEKRGEHAGSLTEYDPFEDIRRKEKLRSRGDMVIDKSKPDKK